MKTLIPAITAATLALSASAASAATVDYTGNIYNFTDVVRIDFTIAADATAFTATTYSYAGGTLNDGTVVTGGGFDPYVWLFAADGTFITANDDGSSVNWTNGRSWDSLLTATLNTGTYFLALSRYGNMYQEASDTFDCNSAVYACSSTMTGTESQYAIELTGVAKSKETIEQATVDGQPLPAVPVPASLPLLGAGLAALGLVRRKKRAA